MGWFPESQWSPPWSATVRGVVLIRPWRASSLRIGTRGGVGSTPVRNPPCVLLEAHLQGSESKRVDVSKEIVLAVAEVRDFIDRLDTRVARLEQSIPSQPAHTASHPVRRLAKRDVD